MRCFVVLVASVALTSLALACSACGSHDTGSGDGNGAEHACLDTIEAFARAAERCGNEYKTAYESLVRREANGDCKNVRAIRDESALRKTCIPFVETQSCKDFTNGVTDPSCTRQLQRPL